MTTDRRIQRTRNLLQQALIELLHERGYDALTVQDVVDRANVGRTTFYGHYSSKDALFMSCHQAIVGEFRLGSGLSREELLAADTPPGMISAFRHLEHVWGMLHPVFQGKDGPLILRRIRDWIAEDIHAGLCAAFTETDSKIPLDVLANYLAGAQMAVLHSWLDKGLPHTPEDIARAFHRLQRATIRDAFGLAGGE